MQSIEEGTMCCEATKVIILYPSVTLTSCNLSALQSLEESDPAGSDEAEGQRLRVNDFRLRQ